MSIIALKGRAHEIETASGSLPGGGGRGSRGVSASAGTAAQSWYCQPGRGGRAGRSGLAGRGMARPRSVAGEIRVGAPAAPGTSPGPGSRMRVLPAALPWVLPCELPWPPGVSVDPRVALGRAGRCGEPGRRSGRGLAAGWLEEGGPASSPTRCARAGNPRWPASASAGFWPWPGPGRFALTAAVRWRAAVRPGGQERAPANSSSSHGSQSSGPICAQRPAAARILSQGASFSWSACRQAEKTPPRNRIGLTA